MLLAKVKPFLANTLYIYFFTSSKKVTSSPSCGADSVMLAESQFNVPHHEKCKGVLVSFLTEYTFVFAY